ncbi:terminase large subunit domain-containing protein [Chryseobacterium gambrini]|uniref:terminase large subunit domain-containing protein n=1 Tax=Chryseobacterium gambrini TaxID=373672 RepID=UPI003D0B6810
MSGIKIIRPQEGYQMKALSSSADILIGGGAAGVGKTFSLLMEPIRHLSNEKFGAVCFRRTSPMIKGEGGLWDASQNLYKQIHRSEARESTLEWFFNSGAKLKFSHMEYEKNKYDWQGSEIPLIMFDELTHFTSSMFFYMLSRNRSMCGVAPYVRATCNPDPDSWLADMVDWWIEQDENSPNYGLPIPERQGVLRYFTRENNNIIWGNSIQEVYQKNKASIDIILNASKGLVTLKDLIKSFTFIGGSIYDNKELLKVNPAYLGNLNALDAKEKAILLGGNWKVSLKGDDIYSSKKFKDIFTNSHVKRGEHRITTDIALKGSDKFVIFVWAGKVLIDFHVMDLSKGNEIIDKIKEYAFAYSVPYSNILFDNDGVGQYVDGFIDGAREFNNGSTPLVNDETGVKENYNHLKSQMFFKSGQAVDRGEYYIPPEVANRPYDATMTLKERLIYERKAIKRDKPDNDGKLCVIPKSEMKTYLNNQSPDLMDCFMMNEWWDYEVNATSKTYSHSFGSQDDDDYYLSMLD